jgi:hypothetical protein
MTTASHSRTNSVNSPSFVDTTLTPPAKDEVESPSLSNSNCLARFEFEPGHSKEGSKVLMVEWEDDDYTKSIRGDWHISWESKTTVLPAADATKESDNNQGMHRMYFLLPPGVAVPSIVTLTHKPSPDDKGRNITKWRTNPLPAIFPPELGASARAAGKKGVLHTIWAKKRLQALQREIDIESRNNVEGVALTMAIQEKEWIESNFGVTSRPAALNLSASGPGSGIGHGTFSPGSPRTPAPGRLMEKLKNLKLGTSDKDLSPIGNDNGEYPAFNPLSPESSDVAISSFAAFKGANPSILAAKPPQAPAAAAAAAAPPRIAAQAPPASIVAAQQEGFGSLNSLDALAAPIPTFESRTPTQPAHEKDEDKEEGLFALPISPRSPEMTKSPFSFAANDTKGYLKKETTA